MATNSILPAAKVAFRYCYHFCLSFSTAVQKTNPTTCGRGRMDRLRVASIESPLALVPNVRDDDKHHRASSASPTVMMIIMTTHCWLCTVSWLCTISFASRDPAQSEITQANELRLRSSKPRVSACENAEFSSAMLTASRRQAGQGAICSHFLREAARNRGLACAASDL